MAINLTMKPNQEVWTMSMRGAISEAIKKANNSTRHQNSTSNFVASESGDQLESIQMKTNQKKEDY